MCTRTHIMASSDASTVPKITIDAMYVSDMDVEHKLREKSLSWTSKFTVKFEDSVNLIGNIAFQDSGLMEVDFGDSVETIGGAAFQNCKGLMKVNFGRSLKKIGDAAFENCVELTEVEFGPSVETIGFRAFQGCRKLRKVKIYTHTTLYSNTFPTDVEIIRKNLVGYIRSRRLTGEPPPNIIRL